MADLEWPEDLVPNACEFYLPAHVNRSVSPLTRATKIYELGDPRWVCRIRLRAGDGDRFGSSGVAAYGPRLDALIARMKGGANRVSLWDFRREGEARAFSNAAIAAGTDQVTLLNTNGGIRVGDYIGGDGRPHIITELSISGANLLADVMPHFSTDVAAGAAVFERVPGWFRLTGEDGGANMTEAGELTIYELDFVEDPGPSTAITFTGEPLTYSG
jgi:hypothetical protein